jgi:hypothetical protein
MVWSCGAVPWQSLGGDCLHPAPTARPPHQEGKEGRITRRCCMGSTCRKMPCAWC